MQSLRDDGEFEIARGLQFRQQNDTSKLVFKEGTEDVIFFKRKTPLSVDEAFKMDHRAAE